MDDDRTRLTPSGRFGPADGQPSAGPTRQGPPSRRVARGLSASGSGEWGRRYRVGDRLGDYVLERELGEGGMGSVFVARQVTTGQEVALKVMLVDPDVNQGALERFRREGQAQAAGGKHPNVLLVHSAGEEAGCAYLVMELARGGDLKARLKQGPLEPRAAAALIAALARGLAHVHAQGVLHRDLKPGNVVFAEDGTPKLMDFGLARLAGADKLTQTGTMLGTPAYMSPEQAGGEPLDERADVYALGAVLYHCLTGRAPFDAVSVMALVRKVLTEEPTPPRELSPELPASLEQVVLRALAKDAGARYPTAKALAEELDRFLAGELVEPRGPGRGVLVGVALCACSVVAAGLAWATLRQDTAAAVAGGGTGTTTEPTRPRARALPPAVTLRNLAEGWLIVDAGTTELSLDGDATGEVVEVRAGAAAPGQEPPVVATSLPARVALRSGWTQVVVRASDATGKRVAVERRDVVRLREGFKRLSDPRQVEHEKDGSVLVLVPPGTVRMSEVLEDDQPTTRVRKAIERPFFLGLHEVTWRQMRASTTATGREPPTQSSPHQPGATREEDPAYNVRWEDVEAYCEWAGLRVPTAEEWIYAACGDDDEREYPWGDTPAPGDASWAKDSRANVRGGEDGHPFVAPVGSFERGRSPFGLHDMFGNVWEFVAPRAKGLVPRWYYTLGGGWDSTPVDVVRSATQEEILIARDNNGMRVAADVDPPP